MERISKVLELGLEWFVKGHRQWDVSMGGDASWTSAMMECQKGADQYPVSVETVVGEL